MPTEFLNVDLDLESKKSLDPLIEELGEKIHVVFNGPSEERSHLAALEIYEGDDDDPDSIINAFCKLLEKMSPKAKAAWENCSMRRFDIGFESGVSGHPLCIDLDPETLERVARLSGSIGVTIYPKKLEKKKKS
jgi:hypothetical protein